MRPYYEQDGITIFHGDCREILPTLHAGVIDLVLTDPPYGIRYDPSGKASSTSWGKKDNFTKADKVVGDDRPFDPRHLLELPSLLILFGANHYADKLPPSASWIVWDKREGLSTNDFGDCEMAWTNLGGPARIYYHLWDGLNKRTERGIPRVHPTQKPIALMQWCLQRVSKAKSVLDPYCGSGTALIAAKSLNLTAIGIEIEERYCEIAAKRLSQGVLEFK